MEIVKPLKGPEGEESHNNDFDFNFKEHYLKQDEKERDPSKRIYIIILGITTISILGYIGFITLKKNNPTQTKITTTVSNVKEINPIIKNEVNSTIKPKQKIIIKEEEKSPVISMKKEVKEVALYTEVLALKHVTKIESKPTIKTPLIVPVAKKEVIKKEIKKIVPKKVVKSKPLPKKLRKVIIKKGDTLALLSQKFYGNPMEFKSIIRANKSIKSHKTSLKLGQEVIIPYMKKSKSRRFVIVKSGYSLAYISKKFYGTIREVQKIVNANHNIKNKNSTIKIGQKIYVPR